MPGVKKPVNSWMYWNAWSKLPSRGLAARIATMSAMTAAHPTDAARGAVAGACGRKGL